MNSSTVFAPQSRSTIISTLPLFSGEAQKNGPFFPHEPVTLEWMTQSRPDLFDFYEDRECRIIDLNEADLRVSQIGQQWLSSFLNAAEAIFQKLAHDLYAEWSRGAFKVPSARLAQETLEPNRGSLQLLSESIDSFQGFNKAQTLSPTGKLISLIKFIQTYHRPPETLLTEEGSLVPLLGIMPLLAIIKSIGDSEGFGVDRKNSGFIWVKNGKGSIVAAQTVKTNVENAFRFRPFDGRDGRDIPLTSWDPDLVVQWQALEPNQKELYLEGLLHCLRYKKNQEALQLLIHRNGKFHHNSSEKALDKLYQQVLDALSYLEEIYQDDLKAFVERYPEQLLRIDYLDGCGKIPWPMGKETFSVRTLKTPLTLKSEESRALHFSQLFSEGTRKVVVIGAQGAGKSSLCQKIVYEWALGKLWPHYKAVYWLSFPLDNSLFMPEEQDTITWLVKGIAAKILPKEASLEALLHQLTEEGDRILILCDGYDQTNASVAATLHKLLASSHFHFLITSKAADHALQADRLVEIGGLSASQRNEYMSRFFARKGANSFLAQKQATNLSAILEPPPFDHLIERPLHLHMFCPLHELDPTQELPVTEIGLYQKITQTLFNRASCADVEADPYTQV